MWAYHDSRDRLYRSPFGAAPVGGTVTLRIDVGGDRGARCTLRTWIDGVGEGFFEMAREEVEDHLRFSCELPCDEPAIVWYTFVIERSDGKVVRYGAREGKTGGKGTMCDWQPPSFQLTVYKPREVKPEWYTKGIVYQIFPDRFRRGPQWRQLAREAIGSERKGPARRVVGRWDIDPTYDKDEAGRIKAWDFYGGTLSGIREKLGHLADMGITVIYLNPIFEAASNHRYDTADYLKIDRMLGDEEAFRGLCEEAAGYGISIVLDGVFNHVGADSRYFNRFGNYPGEGAWQAHEDGVASPYADWFHFNEDGTYDCWWGVDDLPAVDERAASFRELVCGPDGVVRHWLRAGARGWRLDVADELSDDFIKQIRRASLETKDDALVLGEVWEDASNKVSYGKLRTYLLGDELDSAMNYPFRTVVLDFLCGKMNAPEARERLASIVENYPPEALHAALNLLSSHDRPRLMTVLGDGLDHPEPEPWPDDVPGRLTEGQRCLAKGRFWLAALMQMTLAGVPCIYYGDEAGVEGLSDPYNRASFPWGSEDQDCLTMYRNVIQLRQALPVLTSGTMRPVSSGDDVLGWWRMSEDDAVADGVEAGGVATGANVCVLINRSLHESHGVTISSRGPVATEVISDAALGRDSGAVTLTLGPLGSAVVLFDEAARLAKPMEPGAGVVCHITSVPNGGKPGTLGEPSRKFVDFLARCGQRYWQILPVNPTDAYGSPYAGSSVFAGNEALIDASEEDLFARYGRFVPSAGYERFVADNADWLEPYACFAAVSEEMGGDLWQTWPEELRHYDPSIADDPRFATGVGFHKFCQYEFQREWDELRAYANERGVRIIGDIPMYVASASADVWAAPEQFCVDACGRVEMQAGTPPDQFAAAGQLWGNPTYRWDVMREDGCSWWMRRLERTFALYDYVRLDHFLGFQNYYAVPRGATAADGAWHAGPGLELFERAHEHFGDLPLLAEDLGSITPATRALLAEVGCPGMDVLLFADGDVRNGWTPRPGRVAYTSTHDTSTLLGWCATRYGLARDDAQSLAERLMVEAYSSKADVVMSTLQDVMGLGDEARMNVPGVAGGNWRWRADEKDMLASEAFLREITDDSNRLV